MPSTNSFSRNVTAALAVLRSAISTVSRTEMVRPGGVQHQSGQHRAAFRQAASAKVLGVCQNTGELEEASNVTPYARQEWRFVLCPPLQAQVWTSNMSRIGDPGKADAPLRSVAFARCDIYELVGAGGSLHDRVDVSKRVSWLSRLGRRKPRSKIDPSLLTNSSCVCGTRRRDARRPATKFDKL
jgi:hypothetical protein